MDEAVERARGVEPPLMAWEAIVEPFNYARMGFSYTPGVLRLSRAARPVLGTCRPILARLLLHTMPDGENGNPATGRMEGKTMASKHEAIQVTPRQLISVLRQEAAAISPDRHLRNLWADIAARDMVERGQVRIVSHSFQKRAA